MGVGVKHVEIAAHTGSLTKSASILAGLWASPAVWPAVLLLLSFLRSEGVVQHGAASVHPSDCAILALRYWHRHFAHVCSDVGHVVGHPAGGGPTTWPSSKVGDTVSADDLVGAP